MSIAGGAKTTPTATQRTHGFRGHVLEALAGDESVGRDRAAFGC